MAWGSPVQGTPMVLGETMEARLVLHRASRATLRPSGSLYILTARSVVCTILNPMLWLV